MKSKDNEFGDRIFETRCAKGFSQDDFAHKVGVTRQTISKWEAGRGKPKSDKIERMCQVLEISVEELLFSKEYIAKNKAKTEDAAPATALDESQIVQSNSIAQVNVAKKRLSNKAKIIIAASVIAIVMLIGLAMIIAGSIVAPPENDWSFNGAEVKAKWNLNFVNIGWIFFGIAIAIGIIFGIIMVCKFVSSKKEITYEVLDDESNI